ncbi:MAG: integrase core domain-containing protein [bacterium]|nr:integrase core domain-containing protein [bacterium]
MRKNPKEIIRSFKQNQSVIATAEACGVHKTTVYRWIKRSRSVLSRCAITLKYAVRKSTRPKMPSYALTPFECVKVRNLRYKTGWDARKIKHALKLVASHMAVYRYLKRRKLVRKSKKYLRPWSQDTVHMHVKNTFHVGYLQMDVKYVTPALSGLPWTCFEFAIIDIYSRYKDAVVLNQLDQDHAIKALGVMLERLPFKALFIQTDNGLEFQERFREFCASKKLEHHHIHKHTPNENAVIERSFRTDEEEFFFRQYDKPKDYDELQERLSCWLRFYNKERPHLGINLRTPLEVIVADVVLH